MTDLYFPGLSAALDSVRRMDDAALLQHIDSLYGRQNLDDEPTHDDLEREALEQTRRDFRNPEARSEWDYIETMGKIALAISRSPYR